MIRNTLKITFKQAEAQEVAARERLKRAEAGETGAKVEQDAQFILDFEDRNDIQRLMRRSNIELLEVIVADQPESIREVADAADRSYRETHQSLQELEDLAVIEFVTNASKKKPLLRNGAKTIDLPFS